MIELGLQPDLRQTLDLFLSPRMLQMLRILNLSYVELVENITKESEENVMLEVERWDKYLDLVRFLTSDKKIKKEADFSDLPGLENLSDNLTETLETHLLRQLDLEELNETDHRIAFKIIENLDDFGYVVNYPRLRETIMKELSISRPTIDKVLKIIQGFDPEGVGARDLKECLLIQIESHNFENEQLQNILTTVVKDHLEAIGSGDHAQIAQALALSESGVEEIANFIKRNLNPNPGSAFGGETIRAIPSFALEPAGKGFNLVNLETSYGPKITLSASYLKMLEDPKTDAPTREFLKEKLKNAKTLIEDLAKRSETLEKIVRKIIETQADFLYKGVTWLRPLSQKGLAEEFGLHPSTVSRTVAEKYIQTPQGLFPLKFLCPRGPKGLTVGRIKALLAEIIKKEDKHHPLSDSQVTALMQDKGASIDRRTVAYYRQELGLPAAAERQK